jgi:hypothetical protein
MGREAPPDNAKVTARRRQHAADTARWRSRQRRGVALYPVEIGWREIDLAILLGELKEDELGTVAGWAGLSAGIAEEVSRFTCDMPAAPLP